MATLSSEGPNVVTLVPEDAYFFIMNMFMHDPCIHDFSLQNLGADRSDRAVRHSLACSSTSGGGHRQVGGENRTDMLSGIVDASNLKLLQDKKVSEVAEQPTDCYVKNVLTEVFKEKYSDAVDIDNAELKNLVACLQKALPGITTYSIIEFGLGKKVNFEPRTLESFIKVRDGAQAATAAVEAAEEEEDLEARDAAHIRATEAHEAGVAEKKAAKLAEEVDSLIESDKLDNIKGIINYARSDGGGVTQDDLGDIYNIMESSNREQEEQIQEWVQTCGTMQGGGIINDSTNTFKKNYSPIRQKGGARSQYDYPIAAAKTFATSMLFFKPTTRVNGTWFINPYVPTQNNQLKFENEFATKLIRAIKYFNPDATDDMFITQTSENDLNTTTFDISKDLLKTTTTTIKSRYDTSVYDVKVDVSINDLPPNIIWSKTEDSFYLNKTSIGNLDTTNKNFFSKLPEIFSNEMFDEFSIDNGKINDDNSAIKVLFFLYEVANILVIYNYIHSINDSGTMSNTKFGIDKGMFDGLAVWRSAQGEKGTGGRQAGKMMTRSSTNFENGNGERYMLNIILDKTETGKINLEDLGNIIVNSKNYIQVLQGEIDTFSTNLSNETSKIKQRETNIIDFCLDCITHSVVTPLAPLKGTIPEPKELFYEPYIGVSTRGNRKNRAKDNDQKIMTAFLDTFFTNPPPPSTVFNYLTDLTDRTHLPALDETTKYPDKHGAKSIPSFDNPLKDRLVTILNGNQPIANEQIIYINNAALNIYHGNDDYGITNIASIIDPQQTFPRFKTKGGNIEPMPPPQSALNGNMDITIKTSGDKNIFYRVKVTVLDIDYNDKITVKIEAYLKIGNEVLVHLEDDGTGALLEVGVTPTTPAYRTHAPIIINTANTNPLQANICFGNLVKQITDLFNNDWQRTAVDGTSQSAADGGKIQPTHAYKFLCGNGVAGWAGAPSVPPAAPGGVWGSPLTPIECRRLIVESSFQKGLGDFLQEVLGWAPNRGYTHDSFGIRKNSQYRVFSPDFNSFTVMQLNNDTPSGLRAMFFNYLRAQSVAPGGPQFWSSNNSGHYKSICGYLYNQTVVKQTGDDWTKQWVPNYVVSICPGRAIGGGGKKRKTRKKRRVKYSTIRRKSKKTRRSRRKRRKRRRHTTRN